MDIANVQTCISLCSGYVWIEPGIERAIGHPIRTLAYVEIEAFACENLAQMMEAGLISEAPIWSDLRTFPAEAFRGLVDLVSGGFPCPPFSHAGKHEADADDRHLFPAVLTLIERCRPTFLFLENVEGLISFGPWRISRQL